MNILIVPIILLVVILCPIVWFISEFKAKRQFRLLFGVLSLIAALSVAYILGFLKRFEYNTYYGSATHALLEISIEGIEQDKTEIVLDKWKSLNDKFDPTYRTKANYNELVEKYVAEIEKELK